MANRSPALSVLSEQLNHITGAPDSLFFFQLLSIIVTPTKDPCGKGERGFTDAAFRGIIPGYIQQKGKTTCKATKAKKTLRRSEGSPG
jgi:hypothetical protein